ncbi:MAG: hypothetical protein RR090_12890 [Niameybacter sp.]|jgi:hypothetical protein
MDVMKIIIPLCTFLTLVGCTTFTPPAHQKELKNGTIWLTYDASRRGTIVVPINTDTPYRFCAEPVPDVALTLANKIKLGVKQPANDISANGSVDLGAVASVLNGRTETVLLAREAMFRLCEASLNGAIPKEKYTEHFGAILKLVEELVALDKKIQDSNKEAEKTQQARLKVSTLNKLLEMDTSPPSTTSEKTGSTQKPLVSDTLRQDALKILNSIQ